MKASGAGVAVAKGQTVMTETTVTVRDWATQIVRSIGRARRQFIRWWTRLRIAGAAVLILAFLVGVLNYLNQRGSFYLPETLRQIVEGCA
jgi:hypothetical protein